MKEIFISYSRNNLEVVKHVVKEIQRNTGITCWIDLEGIESGSYWRNKIINAINDCNTVLFMLSMATLTNDNDNAESWIRKEIRFAHQKGKRIIPISIDGTSLNSCDWYVFDYGALDWIDFSIPEQRSKLYRDLKLWSKQSSTIERKETKEEILSGNENISETEFFRQAALADQANNFTYYQAAAAEGDVNAMNMLANCYQNGTGVQQNFTKANEWYLKAVEGGNKYAMNSLAINYSNGNGIERRYDKAIELYEAASQKGNLEAEFNLARLYEKGEGVEQDFNKANSLFLDVAEKGYTPAMIILAGNYFVGNGLPLDTAKGFEWVEKAAYAGNTEGMMLLGYRYQGLYDSPIDYKKSFEWISKAADKGETKAISDLARLYEDGKGVEKDPVKAYQLYLSAVKKGSAEAMARIGAMYFKGEGLPRDLEKSGEWYLKAAEHGEPSGMQVMALCYSSGICGFKIDQQKAEYWKNKYEEYSKNERNNFV